MIDPDAPPPLPERLSGAVKVAGLGLAMNMAFVSLLAIASSGRLGGLVTFLGITLIDGMLAALLLVNQRSAINFTLIRAGAGLIVSPILYAFTDGWMVPIAQACVALGLGGLLLGKAGTARIVLMCLPLAVGGVLTCMYWVVREVRKIAPHDEIESIGEPLPENPVDALTSSYGLEARTRDRVQGLDAAWVLRFPGERWRLRSRAATKKDNARADRWVVDPERDAHVLVIVDEGGSDEGVDLAKFTRVVMADFDSAYEAFRVLDSNDLESRKVSSRILHGEMWVDKTKHEIYCGVFLGKDAAYRVLAWAEAETFHGMAPELRKIVESFEIEQQ